MNKKVIFLLSLFSLMTLSMVNSGLKFNIHSADKVVKASVSDYDINGDGVISSVDRTLELRYLNGSLTAYDVSVFDLNDNGIINRVDYEILNDYINSQI
ncbi:MAG: hypothetical protein IKH50_07025 [Oscillospiraceae bacterium]|nr:hypothetical protein [Oscillospiraceae bacterium]MBR6924272.1 hypothetical protein [Oscillospiraceae bacterium]